MQLKDFNKILVIISSKGKNYKKIYKLIKNKLNLLLEKDKYEIKITIDENSTINFTNDFIKGNNNSLIIIAGGDGSVNEVINTLGLNSETKVLIIPNGTGNDFIRTIYTNISYKHIIDNIDNIDVSKIDLIKVNDKICVNIFSFGYDCAVLSKSLKIKTKLPIISRFSYILGIFFTLNKIKSYNYKMSLRLPNNKTLILNKSALLTAICNGKFYGRGFQPAPDADLCDGIININTIDYLNPLKLIRLLKIYKDERHLSHPVSNNYTAISGEIISDDNSMIITEIDGNLHSFKKINFEIIPQSLNICIIK